MFVITKQIARASLACVVLTCGCAETATDTAPSEAEASVQSEGQALWHHPKHYQLVRAGEYRGNSTIASGAARWYMPSVVRDQDGDGVNDLLLGQPYGTGTTPNRQGAVRILSGSDLSEISIINPDDVDPEYGGTFGYSAQSLGDINHDGRTDFAIGSSVLQHRNPDGTLGPSDASGVTYLLKSRHGGGFDVTRILGDDPSGYFGYWMTTVSLGLPRILRHGPPGAPWRAATAAMPVLGLVSSQARFRAGRAWGIEPHSGNVVYRASDDPANNDTISERRGYYVAPAGDIDGNGFTDFLVTANGQWIASAPDPRRYAGRVYFHDGLTGELIRVVEGAHDLQFLGYRSGAAQIDDVNGDGVEDFVVSSGRDGVVSGLAGAGVAYVVSGRAIRDSADPVLRIDQHPEIVLRTHTGSNAGASFGDSVTNLFDMDGDGVDEYAIGALGHSTATATSTGGIFVYSGRTGELLQTIVGEAAGLYLGQQLLADPVNGTLYAVDPYFPDPTTGRSIGRVSLLHAEPVDP
ncbi:RTX toxin [Minicystis rosea]|nr:RTX toxin [Minicystis rosea]